MISILIVLLALSHQRTQTLSYDIIELNDCRKCSIEQLIVWDWSPDYRRNHCQGWILQEHVEQVTFSPPYRFRITSGPCSGKMIQAPILTHTSTTHDPEVLDRRRFDPKYRRGFR